MSAESAAFQHIIDFRWRQGDPTMSEGEARICDLSSLHGALDEAIAIAVAEARADGLAWDQISAALGLPSGVAANRYGSGGGRR